MGKISLCGPHNISVTLLATVLCLIIKVARGEHTSPKFKVIKITMINDGNADSLTSRDFNST
jgi:hypothetical protein